MRSELSNIQYQELSYHALLLRSLAFCTVTQWKHYLQADLTGFLWCPQRQYRSHTILSSARPHCVLGLSTCHSFSSGPNISLHTAIIALDDQSVQALNPILKTINLQLSLPRGKPEISPGSLPVLELLLLAKRTFSGYHPGFSNDLDTLGA